MKHFFFARSGFIGRTARYEINFFPFSKKETTKITFLYVILRASFFISFSNIYIFHAFYKYLLIFQKVRETGG